MDGLEDALKEAISGKVVRSASADGPLRLMMDDCLFEVSASWRLRRGTQILLGSASRPELIERVLPTAIGGRVVTVEVLSGADLHVAFDRDFVLDVFVDSDEYEAWLVTFESGQMIIGGPSDLWSAFGPDEARLDLPSGDIAAR